MGSLTASVVVSAATINGGTASLSTLTVGGVAITGSSSGDRITSGTAGIYANGTSGYISLTTASTTWGYLGSSATYLPNLRTNTVSATTGVQVGDVASTCATGISGTIRYNTSSNTMEYCNGTAWANLGPSATTPVAFSVNKGGANQSVSCASSVKVTWSNEVFDTNNNFASSRFTVTVPGKYIFSSSISCSGTSASVCESQLWKNGVQVASMATPLGGASNAAVTTIIEMSVGDYIEAYTYQAGGSPCVVSGNNWFTNFSGAQIAPQSGAGGGTATPAGSTADVQYNSGGTLAADTGKFTYASSVLGVPTVSATIVSATAITAAGTVQVGGTGAETCGSTDKGKMRVNPTSGRIQVCR